MKYHLKIFFRETITTISECDLNLLSRIHVISALLFLAVFFHPVQAQSLKTLELNLEDGLEIESFNGFLNTDYRLPLVSFRLDSQLYNTLSWPSNGRAVTVDGKMHVSLEAIDYLSGLIKGEIRFTNLTDDTLRLHNVVPFGESNQHVYITGQGDHRLSRTHLFRPGYAPVNVIVPDNAWELGFSTIDCDNGNSVCALVRRQNETNNAKKRRFETIMYPNGTVTYNVWIDDYIGMWQEGLRKIFQEHLLFDLDSDTFDNTLNSRSDLQWIKHSYTGHFMHAWHNYFYDRVNHNYSFFDFHALTKKLYGGDDYNIIWSGWPVLGLDQRNQFDLIKSLPGGLEQVKKIVETADRDNKKIMFGYNPWDLPAAESALLNSTRLEDHISGLQELTRETGISGIMFDTRSESYSHYQAAMDSVTDGFVIFPEGMPVPNQMQWAIVGRVHGALEHPPMLNLIKFIKPDIAIFQQMEIVHHPVYREFATSFFNGYGVEMHLYVPSETKWVQEMYRYLGRTTRILRENTDVFTRGVYKPLLPTSRDSIWVNEWRGRSKTIYTIYSELPSGFSGGLCEVFPEDGYHFVDLWNHEPTRIIKIGAKYLIDYTLDGFAHNLLGTANEGVNGCFARLPKLLEVRLGQSEKTLEVETTQDAKILVWQDDPSYDQIPLELSSGKHSISLSQFKNKDGSKWVVQLLDHNNLFLDEQIVLPENYQSPLPSVRSIDFDKDSTANKPVLISQPVISESNGDHTGMIKVPAGTLHFKAEQIGDWSILPHPVADIGKTFEIASFYIDKFPVTNLQFKKFLDASGYRPVDPENFLAHWEHEKIPHGLGKYPVVYVNLDDARAYVKWAGKRLPTEKEWQYAAQAGDELLWPWGNDRELEQERCNPGNGIPDPVGRYPNGANPLGIEDLVGSVWQMTGDVYQRGAITYGILKGGSYFTTLSSWWYVRGGPLPLINRQQYIFVSPGYERNATVGFRCVMENKL